MNHVTTTPSGNLPQPAFERQRWRWGLALWGLVWLLALAWGPDVLHRLSVGLDVHGHWLAPGLPMEPEHPFADHRSLWGLPNALDVLSNLAFAAAGLWGMAWTRRVELPASVKAPLRLLWWGMLLTFAGSSCYHWAPSATSLVADRIGMSVGFAGMLGLPLASDLSEVAHRRLCAGLCLVGLWSAVLPLANLHVAPWLVLQLGGMLWLMLFAACPTPQGRALPVSYGWVVLAYSAAKLLELHDADVWQLSHHGVAGHTLKHLMAAAAVLPVVRAVKGCGRIPR
jgi:hypothetical protein